MRRNDTRGVSVVAFAVLVLVLAGVVFAGFKVYERTGVNSDDATETAVVTAEAQIPAKITNSNDLDAAEKALDSVNVDEESAALASDLVDF